MSDDSFSANFTIKLIKFFTFAANVSFNKNCRWLSVTVNNDNQIQDKIFYSVKQI